MRKYMIILAAVAFPAMADESAVVTLPSLAKIKATADNTATFMMELAQAEVVGLNCEGYKISRAEAALINGTVDLLADDFDFNPEFRKQNVYGDALASVADPATCDRDGPKIKPLLDQLRDMGGSTGTGE
jgi:hypothetical protein